MHIDDYLLKMKNLATACELIEDINFLLCIFAGLVIENNAFATSILTWYVPIALIELSILFLSFEKTLDLS